MNDPEQITYFADTDARNRHVRFGIKSKDRTKHVYVIGKTGMGKSTLLENMAVQDIRNGNGFAFVDPHGKTADLLMEYIPRDRIKDVIYFAPFDMDHPISFNIMEDVGFDKRHLVVSGLMSTFKKIWQDAWSARMEYILGNTLLALLEYPDSTLLDVNRMLSDKAFRNKVVDNVTDISVKSFWVDEFAKYTDRFAAEATPAIQNKIGQFTSNPLIRNIIGQSKSSFDLREAMDGRKILIVNLSKGRIGEVNANLLGSMLITKIYLAALSRADIKESELNLLPNFYLYVDEFQSFANESFADILSEARKYKLNLTIAHQYIEQMSEEVRSAVFGNVGTMVTFRVGSIDAEALEKEFAPTFTAADIVNLGAYQIYLRLMIDGIGSQPFSARSMPPLEKPEQIIFDEIVAASREAYAKPRAEVEEIISGRNKSQDNSDGGNGSQNNKKSQASSEYSPKNNSNERPKNNERKNSRKNDNREEKRSSSDRRENNGFENKRKPKERDENRKSKMFTFDEKTKVELDRLLQESVEDDVNRELDFEKENHKKFEKQNSNEEETVSLKEMSMHTQKNGNGNDKKGPSEKNSNALRDALTSALGSDFLNDKKGNKNKLEKNEEKTEKESPKNEIPESDLRQMLEI